MSIWFQSPMPKKFQAFFFVWVLCIMVLFASVSLSIVKFNWGQAGILLVVALFFVGIGFMIRKRVLRSLGMLPDSTRQQEQ
jgi:hypothetical protein